MKIFIAGPSGVLGRRLIRLFREQGHSVVGGVRSSEGEEIVRSLGGESHWVDLFNANSLARAAEGAQVIIHAATSIPAKQRLAPADFEMNNLLRREGTRALTHCAQKIGARLYLHSSVVWVAQPEYGFKFDEDSPLNLSPLYLPTIEGEIIAREAGERFGFTTSVLRFGWFYSPDSSHIRAMGRNLMKRRLPLIEGGEGIKSLIHVDDAARACVSAVEKGQRGLWHVVDDRPVTMAEYLSTFAEQLEAPPPRRIPEWVARLVAGNYVTDFVTGTVQTSNARFKRDFNWAPRFPSFQEGLADIIESWRQEGFIPTEMKKAA